MPVEIRFCVTERLLLTDRRVCRAVIAAEFVRRLEAIF
jgi:hypothetical protein